MNKLSERSWLLISVVFAIALTTLALSGIVTQPWHVIPELGADGGKNIFTYLYHVLYDKGLHFSGMNYPYGEHIVFTDAQPVLSVPLSYMKGCVTIPVALTIMWWFIALSYVLSVIYCYKILRSFKVTPLLAILFAGLITICSPQVLRLSAHYALSFCCVLPMTFYWTIRYRETTALKYCLYISLLGCFTTFLHPYFSAVILVWACFYALGSVVTRSGTLVQRLKHVALMVGAAVLPLIVFGLFMKATDTVTDRPAVPYGVLDHVTHIKDIFSSCYSPFWSVVRHHSSFTRISSGGEGYTYIGIAAIMVILSASVTWLILRLRSRAVPAYNFPAIWLILAFMGLLLGGGAPFTWGMSWLLDYASALRQFRTLGRFSWIFYYIITVYSVVIIHYWYRHFSAIGKRSLACGILAVSLAVWISEAVGYTRHTHRTVLYAYNNYDEFVSKNEKNWPQFLADKHYTAGNFQAIAVLPFFATGTEKLWLSSDENISAWSVAMGIKAGMQLHLPMMDAMMSRSSWGQAFRQVKIAGGPYTDKPVLRDLDRSKLLLVLHTDGATLTPDQAYLLAHAHSLGHFLHCTAYALDINDLLRADSIVHADAVQIAGRLTPGADTCINNAGPWFSAHYDDHNYNETPFGAGAVPYAASMGSVICNVPITPAHDRQRYEFSCWFHVPSTDYRSPKNLIELFDSSSNIIDSIDASSIESTDNIYIPATVGSKGNLWLRCNAWFYVPANTRHIRCRMLNFAEQPFMALDELMIRPAEATIISRNMVNNHLLNNKQ